MQNGKFMGIDMGQFYEKNGRILRLTNGSVGDECPNWKAIDFECNLRQSLLYAR